MSALKVRFMSDPKARRRSQAAAFGLAVVLTLALSGLLFPRQPAPRYTVTDLGVLPGYTESSASSINSKGEVVGVSGPGGIGLRHAFLYQNGVMTDLGRFRLANLHDGPLINDNGQVTCILEVKGTTVLESHASVYSGGKSHDLGTIHGDSESYADGINATGEVVGDSQGIQTPGGSFLVNGFFYTGGKMTDIKTLPGFTNAMPASINAQGKIVGCFSGLNGGRGQAFVYDGRTRKMTVLATPPGFTDSLALGINDHAQIIGTAIKSNHQEQAVLWANGKAIVLTMLPGRDRTEMAAINNRGETVGVGCANPSKMSQIVNDYPTRLSPLLPLFDLRQMAHVVIYQNGKMQDLNELIPTDAGWTLEYARAINDRGQIVGQGLHHGQERAFLLTPIR